MPELNAQATQAATPAMIEVKEKFHFKSVQAVDANRHKVWPSNSPREIEVESSTGDDGKLYWRRKTEEHTLQVPSAASLGITDEKAATVLQDTITRLIKSAARKLVDAGFIPTPENCGWQVILEDEYTRLSKTAEDKGASFSRDLIKEVAGKIAAFILAGGGTQAGAELITKMINSRFSYIACRPALPIMDKIVLKIEDWYTSGLTEAEQVAYADVTEYLIDRAQNVTEPPKTVEASAFGL